MGQYVAPLDIPPYERQTFPQMERKLSRLGQRFALKKNQRRLWMHSFWRSCCRLYQRQRLRMSGEPSQRQPLQQHRQPRNSSGTRATALITRSGWESLGIGGPEMMGTRTVGVGLRMTWRKHPTSNGVIGNATATGTHSARAMTYSNFGTRRKVPNAFDVKPGDTQSASVHPKYCLWHRQRKGWRRRTNSHGL